MRFLARGNLQNVRQSPRREEEGPDELDGQGELLEWGFAPEVGLRCEGVRVP